MISLSDYRKHKIFTNRLVLRRVEIGDAADLFEYCRDPASSRYSEWEPHENIAQTKAFIRYSRRDKSENKLDFCITLRDNNKVIGTCGFTKCELPIRTGEIGYCLSAEYQGAGYASEAVFAVCKFGFDVLRLNRIEARVVTENTPSCRLLERLGFSKEGLLRKGAYLKGSTYDLYLYSLTNDDFIHKFKGQVPDRF